MYLWRAVDREGEVFDVLVQKRRDKNAAKKLMRKLLKKLGYPSSSIVTDKLTTPSSTTHFTPSAISSLEAHSDSSVPKR